jgi:mono/diheme cytochrome c family protein
MDRNTTHAIDNLLFVLIGLAVWIPLLARSIANPPPALTREPARIVQRIATPLPVAATATPTAAPVAAQPVAAGDAAKGQQLFVSTCAACHGPNGEGVKGLGKDLITSEFTKGLADDELMAFIKRGRDMSDPLNTTGIAMPPKGGNPALQDEQIVDIIAFLRSIHK